MPASSISKQKNTVTRHINIQTEHTKLQTCTSTSTMQKLYAFDIIRIWLTLFSHSFFSSTRCWLRMLMPHYCYITIKYSTSYNHTHSNAPTQCRVFVQLAHILHLTHVWLVPKVTFGNCCRRMSISYMLPLNQERFTGRQFSKLTISPQHLAVTRKKIIGKTSATEICKKLLLLLWAISVVSLL